MSVVMQRAHATYSPSLRRKKASKLINQPVVSDKSGPSHMNGAYSRTTKQGYSSGRRPLPNGPGPLPNRPKVNSSIFATGSSSKERPDKVRYQNSSFLGSDPVSRRKAYETERAYERRPPLGNGYMTSNSRNKSQSLSSLVPPTSTTLRARTDTYASEKKDYLPAQSTSENDHRSSKHTLTKSSSTSVYRSTTHLDFKGHWENETLQSKGHSFASEKDLSSSSYDKGNFMDTEKARKVTITALPGSDLKYVRKSSLGSSNSTPSVSSINNVIVRGKLWLSCPKVRKCYTPVLYTVDNSRCFESFDLSRESALSLLNSQSLTSPCHLA